MRNTSSIIFYIRKSRLNKNGEATIYLRITVKGHRADIATHQWVKPEAWSATANKVLGNSEGIKTINHHLKALETKALRFINSCELQEVEVSADRVKNYMMGVSETKRTLIEAFEHHNQRMKTLIGQEYAAGTYARFDIALKKVRAFLLHNYKAKDILLKDLNHAFITNFDYYLKNNDKVSNNTSMMYIKRLKRVVRIALDLEWIDRDPFARFKCSFKDTNRSFLTMDEINRITESSLTIRSLDEARDFFLFACYTGLSYTDIKILTPADVTIGIDGNRWITIFRKKTGVRSSIPLLPEVIRIIKNYENHPVSNNRGVLLPIPSNQQMNKMLKDLAIMCKIGKHLTCHVARHTFATSVTLGNDVPLETVSNLLGHKSVKTTQIYARIVDTKIAHDMTRLKQTLYNANKAPKKKKVSV